MSRLPLLNRLHWLDLPLLVSVALIGVTEFKTILLHVVTLLLVWCVLTQPPRDARGRCAFWGGAAFILAIVTAPSLLLVVEALLLAVVVVAVLFVVRARDEAAQDTLQHKEELSGRLNELASAREQVDRVRREARRDAQSQAEFMVSMGHELRAPLNAIIGYSELLKEEAEERGLKQSSADLDRIRAAGYNLLAFLNNILELSRMQAGLADLVLDDFEVKALVDEVVAGARPLAETNGNALEVQCPDDIGAMHADRAKVRYALTAILQNAAKFTEHGQIRLTVSREQTGSQHWLIFRVQDTGRGMDEKQLQNLFRDFAPLDADTLKRYGGTGLSLMIAQRHCQLMQGAIRAESELGKGSTFAMHLPANVEAVAGVQSYDRARELVRPYVAASRAGTVLVVDDDPIVCDLVERVLSKEGYRVVVARNGEDALRLAGEILPDMITLDVIMPGMDGWSVLAALRANRRFALTPIIMLTTSSDNKSKGYTLGASEYLNKPLNREELIAALNKYRRKEQG